MSYILDALRRAESERDRERGVPGLNAQPVPVGSLLGTPSRRHRAAVWVVIGLALGLAVPLGWRWMTADDTEATDPRVAVSGSVAPAAPMGAQAPPAAPAPVPAPQALPGAPPPSPPEGGRVVRPPAELPAPGTGMGPGSAALPPQPAVRPRGQAASTLASGQTAPRPARPAVGPAERTGAAAAASPRPATTVRSEPSSRPGGQPSPPSAVIAAPLQKLSDLPEDLRRQVPTLSFGGSVYSALPAQRMVIFNGQVLREGDLVTDGLSVEEIRAKSAVLRLRGQRFEVVF